VALTIGAVVLRVRDLERETAFWSAALDYVPRAEPEEDWVSLRPRSGEGNGPNLSFDLKRSEYGLPPRFHLDLYADDQAAEVERLTALGAKEIPVPHRPADADWRLMEDPEGNRFDVVQLDEERAAQ
jgi:catechol 2,3-dioxygenase-like lactoylglutathione lyase family enzyme